MMFGCELWSVVEAVCISCIPQGRPRVKKEMTAAFCMIEEMSLNYKGQVLLFRLIIVTTMETVMTVTDEEDRR